MRTLPLLVSFVLAIAASAAQAHDPRPIGWCLDPGTTEQEVAKFELSPAYLKAYHQRQPPSDPDSCPAGSGQLGTKTCGIVDDHWHSASKAAAEECARLAPRSIVEVTRPWSYNDLSHHQFYRVDEGLAGRCLRCVPIAARKTRGGK